MCQPHLFSAQTVLLPPTHLLLPAPCPLPPVHPTPPHLDGEVGIEGHNGRVEDKQKRFHLERLSVSHVARSDADEEEVAGGSDERGEWRLHPHPVLDPRVWGGGGEGGRGEEEGEGKKGGEGERGREGERRGGKRGGGGGGEGEQGEQGGERRRREGGGEGEKRWSGVRRSYCMV